MIARFNFYSDNFFKKNFSWLYRLKSSDHSAETRVGASEQQMLESLISKAKQANFMYLQALGELGKSQRQIQQVN
jgi:hypothetical protein